MATYYRTREKEIQVSEATTVYRQVLVQVGTAEAKTVTVRKAGGSFAASASIATVVATSLFELTIDVGDLDTKGELAFLLDGATDDDYLFGLKVVDHDPFEAVQDILDDTSGTDGVAIKTSGITTTQIASGAIDADSIASDAFTSAKFAAGALTPEAFSNTHQPRAIEVQQNETVAARRTFLVQVGTNEAKTVTVSKCGAAFAASTSTATTIDGTCFALAAAAGDVDTLGDVAWKLQGATNTEYITGVRVVGHSPEDAPKFLWRRTGAGCIEYDSSAGTIKTYDGTTNTATLLKTETLSTSGAVSTWLPS